MINEAQKIQLSRHAGIRCSQRSISLAGIDFVLEYGTARPCGRGCESYSFDRRSWDAAIAAYGARIVGLERYRNLYVIMSADDAIVTAAWRH